MTLKSWLKEFYPTRADEFKVLQLSPKNKLAATEHSLQKWRGLTPENLKKHGVAVNDVREVVDAADCAGSMSGGFDEHYLGVDSHSCSLCQLTEGECSRCPIVEMRQYRCDIPTIEPKDRQSEWNAFMTTTDPLPMIALLEKTREYLLAETPEPSTEDARQDHQ